MENDSLQTDTEKRPVKLPYFHRKLTAEEEAIIGDITPKPLDPSQAPVVSKEQSSAKVTQGSAWNAAGTWESRECSTWCKDKLREIFSSSSLSSSSSPNKVKINKIEKIEGNSSVTHIRGRARFLYEWNFDLDFEISGMLGPFKGSVAVADAINDQLDDIELDIKWTSSPRPTVVDSRSLQKSLKDEVIQRMKAFELQFQNIAHE
jgi:activator of HSP90 ATPase